MPLQNFLAGTPASTERIERFTPQQQQLQNQSINQLMSYLQQGQGGFAPFEQKARTQFATQTIPSIAERFTALPGAQRSSAFQGALGQAGASLEESLAALGSQYGLQQQGLLGQLAMQPSFEQLYIPRSAGAIEASAPGVLQALSMIIPLLIGGSTAGLGGLLGGGLNAVSSLFRR